MNSLFLDIIHTTWQTLLDVAPIVLTLLFFQLVVLKQPLAHGLQIMKGLIYVVLGLALFLVGLERAIFPLGDTMARQLTAPDFLYPDGAARLYLWSDYLWVYVFGFFIGFSTTLAEPALIAVALKAEEISGGSISALGLRLAVASGVAIGVSLGCYRIVSGEALWVFIVVAYGIVIVQTFFAHKSIIPLAYDSGGVTTSTVTVPLLAALGLGLASTIPGRTPMVDGFGLIAFASVFPVITVLLYASISSYMQKNATQETQGE